MPPRKKRPSEARTPRTPPRPRTPRTPRTEEPAASPFAPGLAPECLMCPFGLFFFATRPEVMEHMLKAGHELLLAFKALVEQAAERWERAESLQRIPVR